MTFTAADLTREQLERKVKYCQDLLELAGTIDPGMSLFRGTLLFELQAALVALAKTLLSNDIVTKDGTQVIFKLLLWSLQHPVATLINFILYTEYLLPSWDGHSKIISTRLSLHTIPNQAQV